MTNITEKIEHTDFIDALGERYLAYALSTITSRSLPDVRDGLKPVHRRLLYAMLQLKLDPKSGFKKCARVVGDVIGKYHPHGDVAVYDSLVRLAQKFSVRYPLIEGQGNFGSIDGDNAAAMRYTEARLTDIAILLLEDIDKDTVDFRATYDNQDMEPTLLPASFPNLLANGSEGIAVAMATSIPPHNLDELCLALLKLIKNPELTIEELLQDIEGPDFPTGGIIVEPKANIMNAYATGKGSFRLRCKWYKEQLNHGMYQIVVTEIPYQVDKSKLIEKIAQLFKDKKLVLLGNIRDESTEEIRLILEPKNRLCDAEMLMESLFKLTDLEVRISLNINVLDKNLVPRVMNLKEILQSFLDHRLEIVIKRSKHRLAQLAHRLEILNGLIIAYLHLDEIINIIREEDDAKKIMMSKFFLSDIQAEAILNIRLRSLRKLDEIEIKEEREKLLLEQEKLNSIISDDKLCKQVIASELKSVQNKFGKMTELGKRRTIFAESKEITQEISIEAFIEKEPITILYSKMGWIKSIKGHLDYLGDVKYKEGDEENIVIKSYTTDKIILFSLQGKFFTIAGDKISKGKFGEPLKMLIDLTDDDDIVNMMVFQGNRKLLISSYLGRGFIVEESEIVAQTKSGKQILNLKPGDKALFCKEIIGDSLAVIGENRKLIIYNLAELPTMKRGQGVALQKYRNGGIADLKIFNYSEGLSWKNGANNIKDLTPWLGRKGGIGRLPPTGFPRNNKFD